MYFAYPLHWWAVGLIAALAVLLGYLSYARVKPDASGGGRGAGTRSPAAKHVLAVLRATALFILLLALFRPLIAGRSRDASDAVVPVLVDQSRSMRISDASGKRRIDAAVEVLGPLMSQLGSRFRPELLAFGNAVDRVDAAHLSSPDRPATDIDGALRSVRARYQGRPVAGVILISDGAASRRESAAIGTAGEGPAPGASDGPTSGGVPVFTIGVGGFPADREVRAVTTRGEPLAGSLVDLDVVVSSRGLGRDPFDVRLIAHRGTLDPSVAGRVVDLRRVTPVEGAPVHLSFAVAPDNVPTVYTVEAASDHREAVAENNQAAVVVPPVARKRRILFVEGAPGFEHSFLQRAWAADPAVEVDSVVRKGTNDQGQEAHFIQADPARTPALIGGFPRTKAGLFVYDAIVFGNMEWDFLSREQLAMTADFVRERGGGILIVGGRSFLSPGLAGSPLEELLPLDRSAARASIARTAADEQEQATSVTSSSATPRGDNKLQLTPDGHAHPMMRVAATSGESDRQWAALPPLAATSVIGAPKPGATVLATTRARGATRPLMVVQRYGRGRTAAFLGEGAWRWKMLMPASSRTHEMFWRQAARWLSASSPESVSIVPGATAQPDDSLRIDVLVADADFRAVADATVAVRVTAPGGEVRSATATLVDAAAGRYAARVQTGRAGLYRVDADAHRRSQALGTASHSLVAGAVDEEMADPRLNERVLERVAAATGGRYLAAADTGEVVDLLGRSVNTRSVALAAQPRDIWQHPLVFLVIAGLLATEWALRRRWGLV